jgi:hypothetical protein
VVQVQPALNACPGYYCDPHGTNYWVIAQNGRSATVVFDASASYDIDNDALSFRWSRLDGSGEQFVSDNFRSTNVLSGSVHFRLSVSDGITTTSTNFDIHVLSPVDVVDNLLDAMDKLELARGIRIRGRSALDEHLEKAAQYLAQGQPARAVDFLDLYQKRIAAQSDLLGVANAQELVRLAQAVIDAVGGSR